MVYWTMNISLITEGIALHNSILRFNRTIAGVLNVSVRAGSTTLAHTTYHQTFFINWIMAEKTELF